MSIDLPKFLNVEDLFRDIGLGLGTASLEMYNRSAGNPVGALAIKTAEVTVTMELTSAATKRNDTIGAEVPALGAKTLSFATGSTATAETANNRLAVTLQIVSVIPPKETPADVDAPSGNGPNNPGAPTTPASTPATPPPVISAAKIKEALAAARKKMAQLHLSSEQTKALNKTIVRIEKLLDAGKVTEASAAFLELLASQKKTRG